jgi:hypothetical protein
VLHETLNVINEHITDLSSPQLGNGGLKPGHSGNDSGSEYSSHLDARMSYIQGEETDEEEDGAHTRDEVLSWSADDVAEYLFTIGVEKHHCEVFRDQEITGEVLLGMDQTSVFIKALDLGSVGRRLKTWQKIKALQDEVNGFGTSTRRTTQTYGSEAGSDLAGRSRSRTGTFTSQRLPPVDDRPMSVQTKRRSLTQTPRMEPAQPLSPVSPITESPTRPIHEKRPSAASVRDLHHSRRFSSTDFRPAATAVNPAVTPKLVNSGTFPQTIEMAVHKKQPSFDRNWTLGGATQSAYSPRPLSSSFQDVIVNPPEADHQDSAVDLDRGYFSGPDGDPKRRNVLRKRDSTAATPHSRQSSYAEEQRIRSGTAISRHSRFGSVESVSAAASKYYGLATGPHRRTASTNTTESIRPVAPAVDSPSLIVTKLDDTAVRSASAASPISPATRQGMHTDWPSKANLKPNFGLRAISDAVTGTERSKLASPIDSPFKEQSIDSPSRAGSSTPSAGPSFELDSPDFAKSPSTVGTAGSRNTRKKSKKETSAYLRGLQKITPRQAIVDADYSGWMKKKSSNLMTTWKPRLFVLKGRRLAYYYSEDDDQEKGLIDISFHRVLPADNEKLTGLHATLTGAGSSPAVPTGSHVPTLAATEAAADTTKDSDAMFIFKLVPPRAGLSRAVNFTKPTVHYFACPNLKQGRLWMAALMKATIDRDDTQAITTTYQQKTISLAKARAMRHRPPALMNLDEKSEDNVEEDDDDDVDSRNEKTAEGGGGGKKDSNGLGIYDAAREKMGMQKVESARARGFSFGPEKEGQLPLSA